MNIVDKVFGLETKIGIAVAEKMNSALNSIKSFSLSDSRIHRYTNTKDKSGKDYVDAYKEEIYIYGCVYLISNAIAKLPLKICKDIYKSDGTYEKKDITQSHPANKLINNKPNFKDSPFDLKEQISANLELSGNAYLLLDGQGKNGTPEAVYCLNSRNVEIVPADAVQDATKGIQSVKDMVKEYKYGQKPYKVESILHEKKFGIESEFYGQSPVKVASMLVDTARESRKRNQAIFSNGVSGESAFETDSQYNELIYKRLTEDIKNKYQGDTNYHKPYILFGGLKLKNIGITQKDLEFIQGMKLSREEICGFIYQVPPILLGVLENSSYNNIKEATKIFYNFSIIPRLVKIQELFQKLVDLYGIEGAYVEFDLSQVEALQENMTEKVNNAVKLFSIGIPVNNIVTALGLPFEKIDGLDVGYMPFSMQPVGTPKPVAVVTPPETEEEIPKTVKLKSIAWTEQKMEAKWKKFIAITEQTEIQYAKALAKYFTRQKHEVMKGLGKYKSLRYSKIGKNAFALIGEDIEQKKRTINIESVLFDKKEEAEILNKVSYPFHRKALEDNANSEAELLGLATSFDVSNPITIEWLTKYGLEKCITVVDTAFEGMKEELATGIGEGESIIELEARVQTYYEKYAEQNGIEINPQFQSERIARTETIASSNEGALELYAQSGVELKGWLSANDERVRQTHYQASLDYASGIPLDETFKIGADEMVAPAQGGLAEECCNCRCTVLPIVTKGNE